MFEPLVNLIEHFSVFEMNLYEKFKDLMDRGADPRTKNWLGVTSTPLLPIIFGLAYVHFATVRVA